MRRWIPIVALFFAVSAYADEPLPSWNDGPSKQAIVAFVDEGHDGRRPRLRAAPERIAVFDNDGTLWAEQPLYFQLVFALDRVKALAPAASRVEDAGAVRSVLAGDMKGVAGRRREGRSWSSSPRRTPA